MPAVVFVAGDQSRPHRSYARKMEVLFAVRRLTSKLMAILTTRPFFLQVFTGKIDDFDPITMETAKNRDVLLLACEQ